MTIRVGDEDVSVAWELLASFREMLCAPCLVERDVFRESLVERISQGGVAGAGDREPRTTNVADHGTTSTASWSACC